MSSIFTKPLSQVDANDLLRLVENGVAESATIEYKQELPPPTDAGKKEFLRDVSALANASGGLLIFGIATRRDGTTDTGVPDRTPGLTGFNFDEAVRRWGDTMRTGLQPGLSWAEWHQVSVTGTSDPVLLLRVPAAVVGPHMITFQGAREFWRRGPAGRYQPDVQELRQMFLRGTTWLDQVDAFRRERVDSVRNRRAYPTLDVSSSVFVHVLPVSQLDQLLDLRPLKEKLQGVPPLSPDGWNPRFNTFGFMTFTADEVLRSYTQWFRHGGVEGYSATYRFDRPKDSFGGPMKGIDTHQLSKDLPAYVRLVLERVQSVLGRDPPFAIGLACYGFAGFSIYAGPQFRGGHPIETDVELLPPIIVDDPAAPGLEEQIFSLLDIIWQSAGHHEAPRPTSM
jgi:schlafen family protein